MAPDPIFCYNASAIKSTMNETKIQGLLPNALFGRNCKISSELAQINFEVYLDGKLKNFFGQVADILQLQSKWHLAIDPLGRGWFR